MEQLKWTSTSVEDQGHGDHNMIHSSKLYETPVKKFNEVMSKTKVYSNSMSILPNHFTPPSGLTKFIARNPFESDLTNRLHVSVMSPTVFSKISSPSHDSPDFKWNVEELSRIHPAKIEEFPQQIHAMDPETESKVQDAINQFFEQNTVIPSPWGSRKALSLEIVTPTRPNDSLNSSKESAKSRRDGSCQTILSLPPKLPAHLEEALKPYFTFTQDQNVENDEANSTMNSLRRKLIFNLEDESPDVSISSSTKMDISITNPQSPPQSGILLDGTPLKKCSSIKNRNHGTPMERNYENFSPPNLSPISNSESNEINKSRPRSVARLNFSQDMSIDNSSYANFTNKQDQPSDPPSERLKYGNNNDDTRHDYPNQKWIFSKTKNMMTQLITNQVDSFSNQSNRLQFSNFNKSSFNDNCIPEKSDIFLGLSDHQSHLTHDTGYQTYSINNTNDDHSRTTPIKQTNMWDERFSITEDNDIQLSDWKINIKNVYSSTPSKYNDERTNQMCA